MEEREKFYVRRRHERKQRELEKASVARRNQEEEFRQKKKKALSAPVPVIPRTTHSFLLKTAEVRAQLEREQAMAKRESEEHDRRCSRQRETSKALAEVMKDMNRQRGTEPQRDKTRNMERRARESRQKYRQALQENKTKLENARILYGNMDTR